MVYYLAGSRVTDHYSLSLTLLVPLSFPLAQSPLVPSIIHVHSDSKPQTHNIIIQLLECKMCLCRAAERGSESFLSLATKKKHYYLPKLIIQ